MDWVRCSLSGVVRTGLVLATVLVLHQRPQAAETRAQPPLPPSKRLAPMKLPAETLQAVLESVPPLPLPQLSATPAGLGAPIQHPLAASSGGPLPVVIQGAPATVSGTSGGGDGVAAESPQPRTEAALAPLDYGVGNLATIFHYTDKLVDQELNTHYPYSAIGWLVFVTAGGGTARCTAQLISKSIGVTAGHCVHDGGNGAAGWIRSAVFYPGFSYGESPVFGSAPVYTVTTTYGWYNFGEFDQGYDVGLFVLNKKTGTTSELGNFTGWLSVCAGYCLQQFWYNTQFGYPGNYYDGLYLTESQHLEASDGRDYTFGTGMEGGSSGGAHIANVGELVETDGSGGQFPYRNIVFAVNSWGFVDRTLKVGGASPLTGTGIDNNNFRGMYNFMCATAQALHGSDSCSSL